METLVRLGVAAVELIEAEGRALRRHAVRLIGAAGVGVVVIVLALAGLGFLLFGYFLFLARFVPAPAAAVLVGISALVVAAAGIAAIRRMV